MSQTGERDLFGLAGIAALIRWVESLVTLLSGPLLTLGLAVALIDLLTGGDLLRTVPALLFVWGVCQAVGIDAQLVATWDRCRQAIRARSWLAVVGLLALGLTLGYVGFLSAEAFGFQHAFGVSEAQAMARIGVDPVTWQLQRAALAVFLVALSGFLRYHPEPRPARDVGVETQAERERLTAALELAPLRQQLRAAQVGGVRALAQAALVGPRGAGDASTAQRGIDASPRFEASHDPLTAPPEGPQTLPPAEADGSPLPDGSDRPPTGPGSPSVGSNPRRPRATPPAVLRLPTPPRETRQTTRQTKRTAARANARSGARGTAEQRIRAALAHVPELEFDELVRVTGVSRSTASKYARLIAAERQRSGTEEVAQ